MCYSVIDPYCCSGDFLLISQVKKSTALSRSNTSGTLFAVMANTVWGFPDIADSQPHCAALTLLL